MKYSIVLTIVACVLGLFATVIGQTVVNGAVSGRWQLGASPYVVTGNITLDRNDTLFIEPGVRVEFSNNTQFDVSGRLIAIGTERDSIFFTSNARQPGSWKWIKFNGASSTNSIMSFCVVQYGDRAVHFVNSDATIENSALNYNRNWCIKTESSRSIIRNNIVSNSNESGILIEVNSNVKILNNLVHTIGLSGITVTGSAHAVLKDNIVLSSTRSGINLSEAGVCSVMTNRVENNSERGISISNTNNAYIHRNIIFLNRGDYALYAYRSNNATILNNTIYGNSRTGLGYFTSSGVVANNIIMLNQQDGIYVQNSEISADHNNVYLNTRNNFSGLEPDESDFLEDPQLDQNFNLLENSPVIDRGAPRYRDPDGTRSDIGARFFNQNRPPVIQRYQPEVFESMDGDATVDFMVEATDPNEHELVYRWYVNGDLVGNESAYSHRFDVDGNYEVLIQIDDTFYLGITSFVWRFSVHGSDVELKDHFVPERFVLTSNYPNPFNAYTNFSVELPTPDNVKITLWDAQGRQLSTYLNGWLNAGVHNFTLNAEHLPTGIILIKAETTSQVRNLKTIMLK